LKQTRAVLTYKCSDYEHYFVRHGSLSFFVWSFNFRIVQSGPSLSDPRFFSRPVHMAASRNTTLACSTAPPTVIRSVPRQASIEQVRELPTNPRCRLWSTGSCQML